MTERVRMATLAFQSFTGVRAFEILDEAKAPYVRRLRAVQMISDGVGTGDLLSTFLAGADISNVTNTFFAVSQEPSVFIQQLRSNQMVMQPVLPLFDIVWQEKLFAGVQEGSGGNGTLACTLWYTLERVSREDWTEAVRLSEGSNFRKLLPTGL